METQYSVNIHSLGQSNATLGIKHTPCLSSSIQVNIKVRYSKMKLIASYYYKRHSEVSAEELSRKWGIVLENAKATLVSRFDDHVAGVDTTTEKKAVIYLPVTLPCPRLAYTNTRMYNLSSRGSGN